MLNKFLIGIVLVLVLVSSASALTKPVAGKLNFEGAISTLSINLFVEVDSPLGKSTCKVNPSLQNGADGSFSTNLENLVLADFPEVKCNAYWQAGDKIWYTAKRGSDTYSSTPEEVSLGTGLQMLNSVTIPKLPDAAATPPSSGGGGGGSGGGSGGGGGSSKSSNAGTAIKAPVISNPISPGPGKENNAPSPEEKPSSPVIAAAPALSLQLEARESPSNFNVKIDAKENITLMVILTDEHEVGIRRWEENISAGKISAEFSLENLDGGWYKVQAYAYIGHQLVAVSYPEQFFIQKRSLLSTLSSFKDDFIDNFLNTPLIAPLFYGLSMSIIFVALILYLRRREKRREHLHLQAGR